MQLGRGSRENYHVQLRCEPDRTHEDKPAVRAKGTVSPSAKPMMMSLTTSP